MGNKLQEIIKEMYHKGVEDELFVMEIIKESLGGDVKKSTKKEDTKQHIDFWWLKDNEKIGVDVKGLKKNKRSDDSYDDKIHWVELLNVKGDLGWLYGEAKYIAFITHSDVIFVERDMLVTIIKDKINGKHLVFNNPDNCYVPYQRKGRQDLIVKVPTNDLLEMSSFKIQLH